MQSEIFRFGKFLVLVFLYLSKTPCVTFFLILSKVLLKLLNRNWAAMNVLCIKIILSEIHIKLAP